MTNPRLPDHPIVLVSDAFERLTGFGAAQIVGKNCRFLSGPATSEAAVEKIRVGLNKATPTTTLLLNYKRNGQSFMNLLTILPLFGSDGSLTYFIGGQTEGELDSNWSSRFVFRISKLDCSVLDTNQ